LPSLRALEADLEKLRNKPMFIAWGMRDFCFSPTYLAEWRKRFPTAQVREFPDAGHYLLEDAGAELIPQITEFLTR
jgi:haloalkane dehalogenase